MDRSVTVGGATVSDNVKPGKEQAERAREVCGREGCKRFVFVPLPQPRGVLVKLKARIGGLK